MARAKDDRIQWAIAKDGEHGEFPGRHEVAFKNLTRGEAVQLLMTLDKLQTDRHVHDIVANPNTLSTVIEPSTVAALFVEQTSGEPDDPYAAMAQAMADSTRLDTAELRRMAMRPELGMPYGEPQ